MMLPNSDSTSFFHSELFSVVQHSEIFNDSKTFADAVPKSSYADILAQYDIEKKTHGFSLLVFINKHFTFTDVHELHSEEHVGDMFDYIDKLWEVLTKPADSLSKGSLISLARPYIVPGGRFQEIYYWDSYFTVLGLVRAGKTGLAQDMLDNLVQLQRELGCIPNGNRSYYNSRSQPPVLSLMVELIAGQQKDKKHFFAKYIMAMETEYSFWMDGSERLTADNNQYRRCVRMSDGSVLNRYWDDEQTPRPESFKEDVELALQLNEEHRPLFFRNVRAACESGWDFSSRWLKNTDSLLSIETTNIVPVDLNALLYLLESKLSDAYLQLGNQSKYSKFLQCAELRKAAINKYLWNEDLQYYFDFKIGEARLSKVKSIAASVIFFAGIANKTQAASFATSIEKEFLKTGGLVTTTDNTNQQWDSPNGWAPLQWFTVQGLNKYQHTRLATEIIDRWLNTVQVIYRQTGKLMEKYNVCEQVEIAKGGEYSVQEGFGWTNGVTLDFSYLRREISHE